MVIHGKADAPHGIIRGRLGNERVASAEEQLPNLRECTKLGGDDAVSDRAPNAVPFNLVEVLNLSPKSLGFQWRAGHCDGVEGGVVAHSRSFAKHNGFLTECEQVPRGRSSRSKQGVRAAEWRYSEGHLVVHIEIGERLEGPLLAIEGNHVFLGEVRIAPPSPQQLCGERVWERQSAG